MLIVYHLKERRNCVTDLTLCEITFMIANHLRERRICGSDIMQYTNIKYIKVDCLPHERKKDLCLGGIARWFNLDGRSRCIYYKHIIIKYTSSLVLQAFLTGNFRKILQTLPNIVSSIRRKFNLYKKPQFLNFQILLLITFTLLVVSQRRTLSALIHQIYDVFLILRQFTHARQFISTF